MTLVAVDAFAGAGGISLGLLEAGWEIALAFDNDPIAVETYKQNIGDHARQLDAREMTGRGLLRKTGLRRGELDLLVGGPPCQGFSLQRRHPHMDERNLLVGKFMEFILATMPRSFIMENVPAINSKRGKHLIDALVSATEAKGYTVGLATLNAVDFGLAQQRRRAVIVATRTDAAPFDLPPRSTGPWSTVRDAIGDLPPPPEDGSPHPDIPNHYREARLSRRNIERIKHVPEGGGRIDLPKSLQLACHQSGHRHLDTYGRLAWDQPSGTITARFDSFTRGRFGHPSEHRSITLREGARLQGFRDDFVFLGSREDGARMIGNAVPPPVATAMGEQLKRILGASHPGSQSSARPRISRRAAATHQVGV